MCLLAMNIFAWTLSLCVCVTSMYVLACNEYLFLCLDRDSTFASSLLTALCVCDKYVYVCACLQ